MSVDLHCVLTTHASLQDVAEAVIRACFDSDEAPSTNMEVMGTEAGSAVLMPSTVVTLYHLNLYLNSEKSRYYGESHLLLTFHLEMSSKEGYCIGLVPKYTAFNLALCEKLVRCFGGTITDPSNNKIILAYPIQTYMSCEDGEGWDMRRKRIESVSPITQQDLLSCSVTS